MNRKVIALAIGLIILVSFSWISVFMLTKNSTVRVACVGDSITEGTGYPDDLWMMLGSNYTVKSFGVGGSTASLGSGNPYMNTSAFEEARHFQPNIVIIMLGTNDANPFTYINSSFVDDYIQLIGEFQTLSTKPKIWIATPPPIFSNQTAPNAHYLTQNVIPAIRQVANQTHVAIVDVNSVLAGKSDLFPDGVHPDEQGARLIAEAVYKAIVASTA